MTDLVGEARQRCRAAGRPCKENDADLTMQMGGPYKAGSRTEKGENRPITDARLSAAADLALILSGKDEQILRELDPRRPAGRGADSPGKPWCPAASGSPGRSRPTDIIAARQEIPVGEFINQAKARLARLGISEEQLAAYCGNREWAERFWLWPIPDEAKDAIRQGPGTGATAASGGARAGRGHNQLRGSGAGLRCPCGHGRGPGVTRLDRQPARVHRQGPPSQPRRPFRLV